MSDAPVLAIPHEGWGELVLNRPGRRNALAPDSAAALREGLSTLLAGGARVVLLRGEGGTFCSGLDVDLFQGGAGAAWASDWTGFHRDLHACPAVVICALERYAINAGAALALGSDLMVAGEDAILTVGEAAIGMHAPMNLAWLRLKAPESVAAQLALGAGRMGGADLHRLGLAWALVPDGEVHDHARAAAVRMAGWHAGTLAGIKAALRRPIPEGGDVFGAVQARPGQGGAAPTRIAADRRP
ncbi:enoyl-CoA hydratase/isomerase family protein [Phenylobacterium parvum]|uniref:Enoyl-CoA hydratase/isomerase family protein n=1 Tax=Phenylobacterium parvum TaxID=2201350 RepID=A0A2Z3HR19_9CAUL|nr:enoyl-CoA hydratase/isomerase family protein [Phenylobacterium parvum]AWM78247.1 enoyl-CoA hydratase/isomerase family protein [Phenylobacterium parvum]